MKIWLDTEFYEDGITIELISIGAVAADGREFYAESSDFRWDEVPGDHWIQQNVRPHLLGGNYLTPRWLIANSFREWVGEKPEFWAYYASYDWVVLCQLYGRMVDLPEDWSKCCYDIKQYAMHLGNPRLPQQTSQQHNALEDALWNRDTHLWLENFHTRGTSPWTTIG